MILTTFLATARVVGFERGDFPRVAKCSDIDDTCLAAAGVVVVGRGRYICDDSDGNTNARKALAGMVGVH